MPGPGNHNKLKSKYYTYIAPICLFSTILVVSYHGGNEGLATLSLSIKGDR
jgi:hypothetical protein